jgi:hypothetical protein
MKVCHQWYALVDRSTPNPVAVRSALSVVLPRNIDDEIDLTAGDQIRRVIVVVR